MTTRRSDPEVLEWVDALQAGTDPEESCRRIFYRYYPWVRRFFNRRGFSPADSEDLAQDTFVQVWREIGSFRGASSFEGWLFAIASNVYRNQLRYRSRLRRNAPEVSFDGPDQSRVQAPLTETSPEREAFERQRLAALARAVESLPPQMRECLALHLHQGLKQRQIATLLKISVGTVKSHLFQARQRLKVELGDEYGELIAR